MKQQLLRILFFATVLFVTNKTQAQYVTIPDPNFVNWLNANGYAGCMNGNMMDTTCGAVVNATSVACWGENISDLTGLEYFDSLTNLNCAHNILTSLPALPNFLTNLDCYNNHITSMPILPSALAFLDCSDNLISSLPLLPIALSFLKCHDNQLTSLPALPNSVSLLWCYTNQLVSLPSMPNSLNYLDCSDNMLVSLPSLSNSLSKLNCASNQLISLPTLPNSLIDLSCSYNQLTSLPTLPNSLDNLSCNGNQLTSLPTLPSSLDYLRCEYNQLTSLPPLPSSLSLLWCHNNQLTSLPVLPYSLDNLWCYNNELISLPILPNSLFEIRCSNNKLTSLPALPDSVHYLRISDNPNLRCLPKLNKIYWLTFFNTGIQCLPNYGNVSISQPSLSTLSLCNLFNSDGCQAYWNVSGKVYADFNGNCSANCNESFFSNIKLYLFRSGQWDQSTYTVRYGNYSFDTDTGLYTIEVDTTNLPFTVVCPSTFYDTAYIANNDTMRENKNFALICKPGFDIGVSTIVRDSGIFRPANFANIKILAGDISNHSGLHCAAGTSGAVQLIITGPATYIGPVNGALTPTVNGNTLTYTIPDFGLVDFDNNFQIQVQTDTLAQLGDQVCFDVIVTPTLGDNNTSNNTLTHCFTVVNSYDPNDKSVSPSGVLSLNDKKLTYTIRFQNTGNAPAQHIYLMDTLDANLDVSTFELLAYSHQPQVQLIGNNLRFNFPNINLPDSTNDEPNSHGYVQYSIKLKDSLPFGTIIKNTAYIYFDFNPPVVTNTTSNMIVSSIFDYATSQNNISVYPNPTTNSITIATNILSNNCTAKLFDMLGKELLSQKLISNHTQINLHGLSGGNYLLKVMDGDLLVGVKRVVKM